MTDKTEEPKRLQYIQGKSVTIIPSDAYRGVISFTEIRRSIPDERVQFALALIEKHALVAGDPDGEDSTGRQKMKRLAVADIVSTACDISEKAFAEFEARGWVQLMPSPDELQDMARHNKASN